MTHARFLPRGVNERLSSFFFNEIPSSGSLFGVDQERRLLPHKFIRPILEAMYVHLEREMLADGAHVCSKNEATTGKATSETQE